MGNWKWNHSSCIEEREIAWEDILERILIVMTKGRSTYPTADTYSTAQPQTLLTSAWLKFVQIFDNCLPSTIWCLPTCNLWECTRHKMNSAHSLMGQKNLQQASPHRLRRILGRLEWAYVMFTIFTNLSW